MYNLCEVLRICGILLTPFIPETTPKIFAQLGISGDVCDYTTAGTWGTLPQDTTITKGDALFPRIDVDKEIAELNELLIKKPEPEAAPAEDVEKANIAQIGIEDFEKVELRVARITNCEPIKKAKKLLKLTMDDGEGERTVASGIAKWYKPEDLIGRHVVIVANLKPVTLCGVESCGMLLAADVGEDVKVLFVEGIPAGCRLH